MRCAPLHAKWCTPEAATGSPHVAHRWPGKATPHAMPSNKRKAMMKCKGCHRNTGMRGEASKNAPAPSPLALKMRAHSSRESGKSTRAE